MDRITARSFLQTKTLKDHLDLSVSVNASITNKQTASTENQGRSVLDAMYYYNPLVPVKNADGSWYANTSISQSYNPLSMVYEDQYKTKEKMLQGIAKATLHIIDGLDWNLNLSYQTNSIFTVTTILHSHNFPTSLPATVRLHAAPRKTSRSRWKLTSIMTMYLPTNTNWV